MEVHILEGNNPRCTRNCGATAKSVPRSKMPRLNISKRHAVAQTDIAQSAPASQMEASSRNGKRCQPFKIRMAQTTAMGTVRVITEATVNGRLLRRHSHNGDLLAPRLHVKVATAEQGRDDGAAAEADLRQGRVFGVYICGGHFLQSLRLVCIRLAEIDVGDAAVGLAPAQLDDMDGGVVETEGGSELFPNKG